MVSSSSSVGFMYHLLLASSSLPNYDHTLSLGWLLATILIVILGGYVGLRDRRARKWRDLYELADAERKEVRDQLKETQSQLNEAIKQVGEQKEVIARLDALQMPVKIVELMNESVKRIDEAAARRLEHALEEIKKFNMEHDEAAAQRTVHVINLLQLIADRLGPDTNGVAHA